MKFREVTKTIEASQWFPGVPVDGVELVIPPGIGIPSGFGVRVGEAGVIPVAPGDWIVTADDGSKVPLKPEIFEEMFVPADQDAISDRFGHLPKEGVNLKRLIKEIETDLIIQALFHSRNNKAHAASLLGINRTTLLMKMRALGFKLNAPIARRSSGEGMPDPA
jgi:DNA-binding protein Fis